MNLLTYAEAAKALSVSRATLYRMIERGDLTPVRLPVGGPRIDSADLARLALKEAS